MDRFVVPLQPLPENSRPAVQRSRWKRTSVELCGRYEPSYRREISALLVDSYSEVGAFPHCYYVEGDPCSTSMHRAFNSDDARYGVCAMQFDTKGNYLASVTKSGCLMINDFETLYCQSNTNSPDSCQIETKPLAHIIVHQQLGAVRWNPTNQDEVACISSKMHEVLVFDIAYVSSDPIEVLRKKPMVSIHGNGVCKGLSDVIFTIDSESRVIASDTYGSINIWDRRISDLPCLELATNSRRALNSIELDSENRIIFGADQSGIVHMWDIRGGRTADGAFLSNREPFNLPFVSLKLASLLEKIEPLKAQSKITVKEIHSIDKDPSCTHRLAFHLDDGWSGVLDVSTSKVTHIHCPPPAWLNESSILFSYLRKPSWFSTDAIYVVGSAASDGIHLLDFFPDPGSPCHVDYTEDMRNTSRVRKNRFISLSEGVTACAVHPLNGIVVAGTKRASLLMVSQKKRSWKGEDDCQRNNED